MAIAKRRILFVIKNLQQGGTERQVLRAMSLIDKSRFEIALCTLSPEIHFGDLLPGEPRYSLSARGSDAIGALRGVLEDFRPDLVHSFRDQVNRWVWRALRGLNPQPAWLMSIRGRPVRPQDLWWARLMVRRAFRITVNSRGIEETLRRFGGIPKQAIMVLPNLIDEAAFPCPTVEQRAAARAALALPEEGFVWVLPGRISWVKNQIGLLMALRRMKRDRALPANATVLLAGRLRDRIPAIVLPWLIKLFKLRSIVRVLGPVQDCSELYAAADALILPSFAEGMPNVTLEAQLSGLPAVVTRQANRDSLVFHGESGLVARTASSRSLALEIDHMMQLSPSQRRLMGQNGRTEVLRRFSSPRISQELMDLYDLAILGANEQARVQGTLAESN